MDCTNPRCLGNYEFERIAFFAIKRFVEGYTTIDLMRMARSEQEKEEIALVSMLDMNDMDIRQFKLCCKLADKCISLDYREKLRQLVANELIKRRSV